PAMTTSTVASVSTVRVVLQGLRRGASGPLGGWVAGCAGQVTEGAGIGYPPGGDTVSAANDTEPVPAGEVGAPDIGAPAGVTGPAGYPAGVTGAALYSAPGETGADGYPGPDVGAAAGGPAGPVETSSAPYATGSSGCSGTVGGS